MLRGVESEEDSLPKGIGDTSLTLLSSVILAGPKRTRCRKTQPSYFEGELRVPFALGLVCDRFAQL